MIEVGQKAPDFKLLDQDGKEHSLSYHKGGYVLIYFYPKDDTPGCTTEACGIRDAYMDFARAGIKVFGVSKDSVESHKKFEQKYKLPFTLLADTKRGSNRRIRCLKGDIRQSRHEKNLIFDRQGWHGAQSVPKSRSDHP